jgi:apolipoprotein N-acyltransferase
VLAHEDDLGSASRSMVVEVPVTSTRTPYSVWGDLFAWLAVAAILVILVVTVVRRRATVAVA